MRNILRHLIGTTPQSAPLKGQVANSAGGYSWAVTPWVALDRFLILGTESGSYYASSRALTRERVGTVAACIALDGVKTVDRVVDLSVAGRAPKNGPAILALAMALKTGDLNTRRAAAEAVPKVCRTGTHLYQLMAAVKVFGGWGRLTRRAIGSWFAARSANDLAYQAIKYQSREGWSARDVLRLAHVAPVSAEHAGVIDWMAHGWTDDLPAEAPTDARARIWALEAAKRAESAQDIVRLIRDHRLPREAIGSQWLGEVAVWEALLDTGMPLTALVRNLGKMSQIGLLASGSEAARTVVGRLGDRRALASARLHPLQVLVAHNTYKSGAGVRGKLTWKPVPSVVRALDRAFYLAFDAVLATGLRWRLAVDVSGSMGWRDIAGMVGITPRIGAAAMAMLTARTESRHAIQAFSDRLVDVPLLADAPLAKVLETFDRIPMGRTDCALPMLEAQRRKEEVDVFVVYTDSETWHGKVHPAHALRRYREATGIPAKLIVVGMVANEFTIADPKDRGMLDVVGFDTAAPAVMADFAVA
ncbi:MAG: 60 kDa SS-A/Ro ribonucleoprotein [Myxococcota bacterium]|jgi:60 kDa SS-A/Ro ribonucleoprotein